MGVWHMLLDIRVPADVRRRCLGRFPPPFKMPSTTTRINTTFERAEVSRFPSAVGGSERGGGLLVEVWPVVGCQVSGEDWWRGWRFGSLWILLFSISIPGFSAQPTGWGDESSSLFN
ncbi:hypothetical protein AMECASPLE_009540 [Ameca splendens]|uniref:Uncharacterized protein n=1 Tax=Ameca splendens TaxID=208324 RepID=A0ABV0XP83_9TELE